MDVLAFCLVLLLLTAFVARPLYERHERRTGAEEPDGSERRARHCALVRALRDLEIDRESGAVDTRTYEEERAALEDEDLRND